MWKGGLAEIRRTLRKDSPIDKTRVFDWATSRDAKVLEAVVEIAWYHWKRVKPPLTRGEFGRLLARVWTNLLGEELSPHGLQPYIAARMFGGWMVECWRERETDADARDGLAWGKGMMETLYRTGDERGRRCLVDGLLEHLFEMEGMRQFFEDWRQDETLRVAFEEADLWARTQDM